MYQAVTARTSLREVGDGVELVLPGRLGEIFGYFQRDRTVFYLTQDDVQQAAQDILDGPVAERLRSIGFEVDSGRGV